MFKIKKKNKNEMGWNTLSIEKFMRIYDILDKGEDEDTVFEIAAICYGMTLNDILSMPIDEATKLVESIAFIYTPPKKKLVKGEYTINGRKYRATLNMDKITTAQYIDFQTFAPECEKHLAQFLSIILIPEGKKYNTDYDLGLVQKDIAEYLSVEEALSLSSFFTQLSQIYIQHYLRAVRRMLKKVARGTDKEQKEQLMEMENLLKVMSNLVKAV